MFIGIQIIGAIFGLGMLYLTHMYYKRSEFGVMDALFWGSIWIVYLYSITFPSTLNIVFENLGIIGAMDFFMVAGFLVLFGVVFNLYGRVRKTEKDTRRLVKKIAFSEAEK